MVVLDDIQTAVRILEYRYKNIAYGDEKSLIIQLLQLYYPIIQQSMTTTKQLRESKMNLIKLKSECCHMELVRDKNSKYIYKCINCGKTVVK